MAFSIGSGVSSQATMRPVLVRLIRPASDSTSRCFITAGSDIGKRARKLAHRGALPAVETREQCTPRRVGKRGKGAVEGGILKLNH